MAAQHRKILVSRPAKLGILINKGMKDYVCACKEPKDRKVNRKGWQENIRLSCKKDEILDQSIDAIIEIIKGQRNIY
jgi:hypothetical protein